MSKKNKKNTKGIIYSTNPNFEYEYEYNEQETLLPKDQYLRIHLDKHRAGKIAVIIKDFIGSSDDLKTLSKVLKNKCGVGGTSKNGQIIIQGDIRNKVICILEEEGYNCKKIGG